MIHRERTVLTIAAILLAAAPARADDSDLEALLNETVVTTASKSAETSSTAPATSSIITAEDIRNYGMHSLDEAINFLALGAFTSNTGRAVDVGARGVTIPNDQGGHFLMLVNGHAVNEPLFGTARFDRGAGIPLELVDHIEVILGPGSVLYGSNAMLGVVNIVTKNARDFQGVHVALESEIGKSTRVAAGMGYEIPLFGSKADVTAAVDYYRQRGPDLTLGPQDVGNDTATLEPFPFSHDGPATGQWGGVASHSNHADIPSGHLRLTSHGLEVNLHASIYKRASPFNHRFVVPDSDFDDPQNYEMDRNAWADVKYTKAVSRLVQIGVRVYGDTFDYQRHIDASARTQCLFTVTTCRHSVLGASRWLGAEVQTSLDWFADARFSTLIGVDARTRYVGTRTDVQDYDTDAYLASSQGILHDVDRVFGAYLQQTWQPTNELAMNAGGRLDYDQRYGYQASPRIAVAVGAWHGGTLKAVYSEAFRAPSWAESNRAVDTQLEATGLGAETVRSVETSVEQKLGAHHLLFGIFASMWSDLVELKVLTADELQQAKDAGKISFTQRTATQFRNISTLNNVGWNAGYDGSMAAEKLRYALNVTSSVTLEDHAGIENPLPVAPRLFGNARVSYALPDAWPTVGLAAYYFGKRPADRAFDGVFVTRPYAPAQVELRATFSGKVPPVPHLTYRVSANYAFAAEGPYVVGPAQGSSTRVVPAELIPVDRFRITTGVQYDF